MYMKFLEVLKQSLNLLDKRAKKRLYLAAVIQVLLGFLDLIGVALSGITGSLAASSLLKQSPPAVVNKLVNYLQLSAIDPATTMLAFSLLALLFFIIKSFLAIYFSRRVFNFLAGQQSKISADVIRRLSYVEYIWIKNQSPHELTYAVTTGITSVTVNYLGQCIILLSEISLITLFLLILLALNPLIAIGTITYLSLISFALVYALSKKVSRYGKEMAELSIESHSSIFNSLALFREIRVLKRNYWFEQKIISAQKKTAETTAMNIWIQQIPKYILEIALLLGVSGLLLIAKSLHNQQSLIPLIAVYLAAAARVFPSLLRMQSSLLTLRSISPVAEKAFVLINYLDTSNLSIKNNVPSLESTKTLDTKIFVRESEVEPALIQIKDLTFCYPESKIRVIDNLNFSLNRGEHVVITGPSGAGKSTLCDLLLGLLSPTYGSIKINSSQVSDLWKSNDIVVSYLPQDTRLIDGTVLENICLGLDPIVVNRERVSEVLKQAQLSTLIDSFPLGIETQLGQQGTRLSGGQRQRMGIARSLYAKPDLLVMDESTSALDAETEHAFMSIFKELDTTISVVLIAHRLSSIRNARRILYLENGKLLADGTFAEVRKRAKNFNRQAELSGL